MTEKIQKYAIIQLAGKQYLVREGEFLEVDRLIQAPDEEWTTSDVLLIGTGESVVIGNPIIDKAKVTLKVIDQKKGDKIRVVKYKSKSRYRRLQGHRQALSTIKVLSIASR